MIDKGKIKRSFNIHARSYDQAAHLQWKVAGEVIKRVVDLKIYPTHILDVGTGTGYVAWSMRSRFPSAQIHACDLAWGMLMVARAKGGCSQDNGLDFITADAEFLPYGGERFDLVVSNLTYQWVEEGVGSFREVVRVLRPGGIFLFSTLGTHTLSELRNSYLYAYRELGYSGTPHLHTFVCGDSLKEMLIRAGFREVLVECQREKEYHGSVRDLLLHLKTIGAQNASAHMPLGLGKPGVFRKMVWIYEEQYRCNLGIPATYEVLFGYARKS